MANREITYKDALAEGLLEIMTQNPEVIVMGQSGEDPVAMFGTLAPALKQFPERFFEMPLSEAGITGWGTGAAIGGLRPVMTHHRNDFLLVAADQIINHAAKWSYDHQTAVPWTIRSIVGRGWGQASQHSQSLQALFAHIPGLKVVMPTTPFDAKGLLISSIMEPCPVILIEHRRLYDQKGEVPEDLYQTPLGQANITREGGDITIVAISQMTMEANLAALALAEVDIHAEIVDPRTIRPLDHQTILSSVRKTGRLIVCDTGWTQFGVSAEIAAIAADQGFDSLKAPIKRIGLPDCPTPASYALEQYFYPGVADILQAATQILPRKKVNRLREFTTTNQEMAKFIGIF